MLPSVALNGTRTQGSKDDGKVCCCNYNEAFVPNGDDPVFYSQCLSQHNFNVHNNLKRTASSCDSR